MPVPALFFVGAALIAWFVLERTYFGRQIYAVGGNREAARLAGIPVRRRIVATYVASAMLAGLVGILIDRPDERRRPVGRPAAGS